MAAVFPWDVSVVMRRLMEFSSSSLALMKLVSGVMSSAHARRYV